MFHLRHNSGSTPDAVMQAMFAARKKVFVDLLKWDVPVLDGRFEVDQFDDQFANYLILADSAGTHLGSARILPTTRPHILGDLFPDLCEPPSPRGPGTFEITRFCLDRGLTARERREVRDQLVLALVDHALANGISRYVAIAEMGWYRQIVGFGWQCTTLGAPREHKCGTIAAICIAIDETTPARLAAAGVIAMPSSGALRRAAA
jgi:N-acyl-L-homoserine lactone synthetase